MCGGIGDRMRSFSEFVALAALSKRVLLIKWARPFPFEHFVVPSQVNWSTTGIGKYILLAFHDIFYN